MKRSLTLNTPALRSAVAEAIRMGPKVPFGFHLLQSNPCLQVSQRRLLIEQVMDSLITTEKKLRILALDYET